jgi:hypothetical protein
MLIEITPEVQRVLLLLRQPDEVLETTLARLVWAAYEAQAERIPAPEPWLEGEIKYYKRAEGFGFIGADSIPHCIFSRDDADDQDLLAILDNPQLYLSGTPVVFQDAGMLEDDDGTRRHAAHVRLRVKKR